MQLWGKETAWHTDLRMNHFLYIWSSEKAMWRLHEVLRGFKILRHESLKDLVFCKKRKYCLPLSGKLTEITLKYEHIWVLIYLNWFLKRISDLQGHFLHISQTKILNKMYYFCFFQNLCSSVREFNGIFWLSSFSQTQGSHCWYSTKWRAKETSMKKTLSSKSWITSLPYNHSYSPYNQSSP